MICKYICKQYKVLLSQSPNSAYELMQYPQNSTRNQYIFANKTEEKYG